MKSGPDVFADALVPPGTSRSLERPPSPERSDSPRNRRAALNLLQFILIVRRRRLVRFGPLPQARHRSRIRVPARRELPTVAEAARFQIICWNRHCTACCAGPVTGEDGIDVAAMVIVLRNRRVNRISRLLTSPCAAGIFAILRSTARCVRLHPVHREP